MKWEKPRNDLEWENRTEAGLFRFSVECVLIITVISAVSNKKIAEEECKMRENVAYGNYGMEKGKWLGICVCDGCTICLHTNTKPYVTCVCALCSALRQATLRYWQVIPNINHNRMQKYSKTSVYEMDTFET